MAVFAAESPATARLFAPDAAQYPFASHYLPLEAGRLHYLDEGQGEPVVFVHGTPEWSFLFREPIRALAPTHRCIAPDHLGFGLSDKPPGWTYHPRDQAQHLERLLVDHLDLRDITLVVHDFGGPIGLGFALKYPERIRRLVVLNTWLGATNADAGARRIDAVLRSWLGRLLYLRLNFSPRVLLKQALAEPKKLPKAIHAEYLKPFPHPADRWGLLRTGQWLVGASDWYAAQAAVLAERLGHMPTLLLWGVRDAFVGETWLRRWQEALPTARTVRLDCGHFGPEEMPTETVAALRRFLAEPNS